jgi:hypothetical protein
MSNQDYFSFDWCCRTRSISVAAHDGQREMMNVGHETYITSLHNTLYDDFLYERLTLRHCAHPALEIGQFSIEGRNVKSECVCPPLRVNFANYLRFRVSRCDDRKVDQDKRQQLFLSL